MRHENKQLQNSNHLLKDSVSRELDLYIRKAVDVKVEYVDLQEDYELLMNSHKVLMEDHRMLLEKCKCRKKKSSIVHH